MPHKRFNENRHSENEYTLPNGNALSLEFWVRDEANDPLGKMYRARLFDRETDRLMVSFTFRDDDIDAIEESFEYLMNKIKEKKREDQLSTMAEAYEDS